MAGLTTAVRKEHWRHGRIAEPVCSQLVAVAAGEFQNLTVRGWLSRAGHLSDLKAIPRPAAGRKEVCTYSTISDSRSASTRS
jgi:hypothetical protein